MDQKQADCVDNGLKTGRLKTWQHLTHDNSDLFTNCPTLGEATL